MAPIPNKKKTRMGRVHERKVPWKARKIEIKYIEDKNDRSVKFTKRRNGLFSMAERLAADLGLEVSVIAISQAGTPYAQGTIDRFLNAQQPPVPIVVDQPMVGDDAYINQTLGAHDDDQNMSEALRAKIQDEMDSLTPHIDHRLNYPCLLHEPIFNSGQPIS